MKRLAKSSKQRSTCLKPLHIRVGNDLTRRVYNPSGVNGFSYVTLEFEDTANMVRWEPDAHFGLFMWPGKYTLFAPEERGIPLLYRPTIIWTGIPYARDATWYDLHKTVEFMDVEPNQRIRWDTEEYNWEITENAERAPDDPRDHELIPGPDFYDHVHFEWNGIYAPAMGYKEVFFNVEASEELKKRWCDEAIVECTVIGVETGMATDVSIDFERHTGGGGGLLDFYEYTVRNNQFDGHFSGIDLKIEILEWNPIGWIGDKQLVKMQNTSFICDSDSGCLIITKEPDGYLFRLVWTDLIPAQIVITKALVIEDFCPRYQGLPYIPTYSGKVLGDNSASGELKFLFPLSVKFQTDILAPLNE